MFFKKLIHYYFFYGFVILVFGCENEDVKIKQEKVELNNKELYEIPIIEKKETNLHRSLEELIPKMNFPNVDSKILALKATYLRGDRVLENIDSESQILDIKTNTEAHNSGHEFIVSAVLLTPINPLFSERAVFMIDQDLCEKNNKTVLFPAYSRIICEKKSDFDVLKKRIFFHCKKILLSNGLFVKIEGDVLSKCGLEGLSIFFKKNRIKITPIVLSLMDGYNNYLMQNENFSPSHQINRASNFINRNSRQIKNLYGQCEVKLIEPGQNSYIKFYIQSEYENK